MAGMAATSTVPDLLARRLAAAAGTPAVTTLDHRDGDRVELSAAALVNWVAKTGNYLDAELGIGPGDEVVLVADLGWTAWVAALACWSVGATVVPSDPGGPLAAPARAWVVAQRYLGALAPGAGPDAAPHAASPLLVLGEGMGGRALGPLPAGAIDFGTEVLAEPDELLAPAPSPSDPAVRLAGRTWTQAELVARADAATRLLGPRLAVVAPLASFEGLVLGLLAPLAAGGQAVGVAGLDPDRWWPMVEQERTEVALITPDVAARLPDGPVDHPLSRLVLTGPPTASSERDGVPSGLDERLGCEVQLLA